MVKRSKGGMINRLMFMTERRMRNIANLLMLGGFTVMIFFHETSLSLAISGFVAMSIGLLTQMFFEARKVLKS